MAVKFKNIRIFPGFSWLMAGVSAAGVCSTLASASSDGPKHLALTVGPDVPHVLVGEVDLIASPRWQIGINGGGFAYTFQTSPNPTPLSIAAIDARIMWHPFSGAFFFAVAGGGQNISGSQTQNFTVSVQGQNVTVPATASISLFDPNITPYLGWQVVTRWGFTFALEAGAQYDFGYSSTINATVNDPNLSTLVTALQATPAYQQTQDAVQSKIDQTLAQFRWLPYVALRIGWAF